MPTAVRPCNEKRDVSPAVPNKGAKKTGLGKKLRTLVGQEQTLLVSDQPQLIKQRKPPVGHGPLQLLRKLACEETPPKAPIPGVEIAVTRLLQFPVSKSPISQQEQERRLVAVACSLRLAKDN